MAQTIKLKRSATQNAVPSTSQLELGEVAINTYDGKMYIKKSVGGTESVVEIGGDATSSSGLDFTGNLNLADDVRIVIGDGNDLQIYHDGSNSFINDSGTGNLTIRATNLALQSAAAENYLFAAADGSVTVYHDNSAKFATTSTGATVTGTLVADGLDLGDDNILNVGTIAVDKVKGDADDNTNITFAGNDITAFYQGGAEKIRIDADGRLLVNTTSSIDNLAKIQVVGDSSSIARITLQDVDGTNQKTFFEQSGGGTRINTQNGTSNGYFTIGAWNGTASSDFVRVDSNGNVGVKETTPSAVLHVTTDADADGIIIQRNSTTAGTNAQLALMPSTNSSGTPNLWIRGVRGATSYSQNYMVFGTNSTERLRIDSAGNIGIGTTSPSEKLEVTGTIKQAGTYNLTLSNGSTITGSNHVYIKANSSYVRIDAPNNSVYYNAGTDHIFRGGDSTEYMRIDTNGTNGGNVGIGTSSPDAKLVISSGGTTAAHSDTDLLVRHSSAASTTAQVQILSGNTGSSNLYFSDTDAYSVGGFQYNHSNNYLAVRVNAAERMRIDSSGNLLVGKTSSAFNTAGAEIATSGRTRFTRDSANVVEINRTTDAGSIITFNVDGSMVGNIGSNTARLFIHNNYGNGSGFRFDNGSINPASSSGANEDNTTDLGTSSVRFKDLHLSGQVNTGTISSGNITTTGYLAGPATFTIDPAAVGDNTGTVVIAGNLQVDGTTTTINSTTLTVDDKNITLASGSTNAAAANGAGITVDCGSDTDATFSYQNTGDRWTLNKPLHWTYATATTALSLNNNNIIGVNNISFADPGNNEGLQWSNIRVFEAPNDLSNTSGNLQVTYGGTRRLTVNNTGASINGNLGVGTDSPISKVDVLGDGKFRGTADATPVLKLGQHSNSATTPLVTVYTDDLGSTRPLGGDALEFNMSRYGQVIGATRGSAAGGNVRSWKFTTSTNSNERGVDLILYSQADSSATGSTTTAGNVQLSATSNRNSYINTSGNFGLGTAAPATKLHLSSTSTSTITVQNTTNAGNASLHFRDESNNDQYKVLYDLPNNRAEQHFNGNGLRFYSNQISAEVAKIGFGNNYNTSYFAGRVGVGTSAPAYPMEISGDGTVSLAYQRTGSGVTAKKWGFHSDNSNTYWQNITDSILAITVSNAGKVGIGTTAPQSNIEVNLHSGATSSLMDANTVNDVQLIRAGYSSSAATTSNAGAKWGLRFVGRNDNNYDNQKSGAIYAVSEDSGAGYNRNVGLAFHTSGFDSNHAERMRITNTGRVGIGTNSPSEKLHVTSGSTNSNTLTLIEPGTTAGNYSALQVGRTDGSSVVQVADAVSGGVPIAGTAGVLFGSNSTSLPAVGIRTPNSSAGHIVFNPKGTEKVRITADGDVGIGTSSPTHNLHIQNSGSAAAIKLRREDTADEMLVLIGSSYGYVQNTTGPLGLGGSNDDRDILIDTSGRVGIGTTSPGTKLHISDSATPVLRISHTAGTAQNVDIYNSSGTMYLRARNDTANGPIIFQGGGGGTNTEYARFQSTGYLGVGTTGPSRRLHVKDTNYNVARLERDGSGGGVALEFRNGDGNIWQVSNDGDEVLRFYYASNNRFQVTSTGAATFNNAFTLPTTDGSANQVLKTDGSGNVSWATEAAVSASTTVQDADGDTKIQVEESADEDLIRFDAAGTERFRIGSDVQVLAATDFNITGANRRLNFTSGTGTVRTTGASSLHLATNNTNRLNITSDGKVGINETSPAGSLHISNAAQASLVLQGDTANSGDSGEIDAAIYMLMDKGAGNDPFGGTTHGAHGIRLSTENHSGAVAFRIDDWDSGSYLSRMYINTSGDVGIGTTSPNSYSNQKVLTINGTTHSRIDFETADTLRGSIYGDSGSLNLDAGGNYLRFYTGNTQKMTLLANGNLGIGINSPTKSQHLYYTSTSTSVTAEGLAGGAAGKGLLIQNAGTANNSYANLDFRANNADGRIAYQYKGTTNVGDFHFITDNTNSPQTMLFIKNDGDVGVGTTVPDKFGIGSSYKYFTVGSDKPGIINLVDSGTAGSYLQFGTAAGLRRASMHAINGSHLVWTTNGSNSGTALTERMRLTSGGYLMIGKTNPTFSDSGIELRSGNLGARFTRSNAEPILVNRTGSNGNIVLFYGQGTHIGSIGTGDGNSVYIECPVSTKVGLDFRSDILPRSGGALSNGGVDLGAPNYRFRNIELSAAANIGHASIQTDSTTTSATTQVAIDAFAASEFRSAEFTIQVTNSTDSTYHMTKVLLIHDGTTPGITEYGTVFTGSAAEATFDADISSGNVRLLATPASTDSMTFKVVRHCITV